MIDGDTQALHREIGTGTLTPRFRLLGMLPLLFFILHANYYRQVGGIRHMLWMCNIGNLVLAVGLFLAYPLLIRVAVIWLLPGLPIWLWFVVRPGWWILTSFLAHAGGLIVGLIAIRKVRASRWMWLQALVWYLFVQAICRLFTPAELNLNGAHLIYGEFETMFNTYWQFWIVGTLVVAIGLWVIGFALLRLFPPTGQADSR
ncbi:MAG: hypothetical protein WAU45_23060 [Blastocatellia bacterium]